MKTANLQIYGMSEWRWLMFWFSASDGGALGNKRGKGDDRPDLPSDKGLGFAKEICERPGYPFLVQGWKPWLWNNYFAVYIQKLPDTPVVTTPMPITGDFPLSKFLLLNDVDGMIEILWNFTQIRTVSFQR